MIVFGSLFVALLVGIFVWQSNETKPIARTSDNREVTQLHEGNDKAVFVTPEENEDQPIIDATNDPQTEAALAAQAKEKEYCSSFEKACFTYPNSWTFTNSSTPEREIVELASPNGTRIAWETHVAMTPQTCEESAPHAFLTALSWVDNASSHARAYLGTELFKYKLIGLEGSDEATKDDRGLYLLGDLGVCFEQYNLTFKSKQDSSVELAFRTKGTDLIHTADIPILEQIFKTLHY